MELNVKHVNEIVVDKGLVGVCGRGAGRREKQTEREREREKGTSI
jgi:hypothetical protein